MVGGEVGKDASKKGTTSTDVVVQAFAPTSSNLHTVAARDPILPGKQGAVMGQQQPCPAAVPRDSARRSAGRSSSESSPAAETGKAGQQPADLGSFAAETSMRKGKGSWQGEEGRDQKKPQSPSPPTSQSLPSQPHINHAAQGLQQLPH
jgi:hypothetical protein